MIGIGWCRPDGCDVEKDKECRVDGFWKNNIDLDECMTSCLQEPTCTGIGHSNDKHGSHPNHCYVHGNTASMNRFSEWHLDKSYKSGKTYPYKKPNTSSGQKDTKCWRRKGIKSYIL